MKILDELRHRLARGDASDQPQPADAGEAPFPGYDKLDHAQVAARLHRLSQVDLAAAEEYERAHADRPQVLNKLRYLRTNEPLPGYDALEPDQIADALAGADAETIKRVRDYERKFAHRPQVMADAVALLGSASASATETQAREERDARVRDGISSRQKTADVLSDDGRPAD